ISVWSPAVPPVKSPHVVAVGVSLPPHCWPVTVNEQLPEFPQPSTAVQVTVVVPVWNTVPDGGTHVTGTLPAQLSVAVAVNVVGTLQAEVMFPGQRTTGPVLSWTLIVWLFVELLPQWSVAVQVRVTE